MPDTITTTKPLDEATSALVLTITQFRTSKAVTKKNAKKMVEAIATGVVGDVGEDVSIAKSLLKHPLIKNVKLELGRLRDAIYSEALPVQFLKGGIYLFANTKIGWAEERVATTEKRIDDAFGKLAEGWDEVIEAERERLEPLGLFNPDDYLSLSALREKVTITYRWAQFTTPTSLKEISPTAWATEKAKAKAFWDEMGAEIRSIHRQSLLDALTGLKETLAPGEDGKRKVLRQDRVEKTQKFLREYALNDPTGDEEARAYATQMADILKGVDAEVIRTEDSFRERLDVTLSNIKDGLQPLVVESTRKLKLTKKTSAPTPVAA